MAAPAPPLILSHAALPSLTHSLDASDVLECYLLTRHAPLHLNDVNLNLNLTTSPMVIPKSAIGLRYYNNNNNNNHHNNKEKMELTLEYGPQRLGINQEEEALPLLYQEGSFVSWQNEAKIYYSTSVVSSSHWESAHYMASITGVVLEKLLQKAVDYPKNKRYQPFVATLVQPSPSMSSGLDNNNNYKIVLKSSSDLDFLNYVWESLATLGVSLHPLLPPRQYEARLYATDISKLASGQVVVVLSSDDTTTSTTTSNSTVAQEAFSFFSKLQTCIHTIATAQDPPQPPQQLQSQQPTSMPTNMPTTTTTSTNEPTNSNTPSITTSSSMEQPIHDNDNVNNATMIANNDANKNGGNQVRNNITGHNATDNNDVVDNATTGGNDDNDDDDEVVNDDDTADEDVNNDDQVDNADNDDDDTQDGGTRFRLLSSWQQYIFPQSQEVRGIEDGSVVVDNSDSHNNETMDDTTTNNNATTIPPNEAQVANEAAQEAKEAAKEAKEAATTEADTRAADAAEAAANAAQKAANVTFLKRKQLMQQNLLSGDGHAISTSLRECFTNPQYQLASEDGSFALVYLYLDGATYYRLNLTAPYLDVALVERHIPQAHEFASSAGEGGDLVDCTLALGTIAFFVIFVVLMLQRAGFRFFPPLYKTQKWYFEPCEIHDGDQENAPIGQGYEHAFGEDVIPLSMGGRRPTGTVRKRGQVVPAFQESSNGGDHSGDVEMVDNSAQTPRRSSDSSRHDLGFGPSSMDMHSLPGRLARDPDLVDLPNLSSGSKVAVPVSIQHQRSHSRSRELTDIWDDDDDSAASQSS